MGFVLHGHGWGTLTFDDGASRLVIENVSYLGNPLGELVTAAVSLAVSRQCRAVYFVQEPGLFRLDADWAIHEYAWEDRPEDGSECYRNRRLRIFERADPWENGEATNEVWASESAHDDLFPKAVLTLAEEILATHGADGFREKWDSKIVAFPHRGVAALRAALAVSDEDVEW